VIGVVLGAGMSANRVVRNAVDPVIEVLRPLPQLAFIPLFIIWLEIGEMPKEVLIMVGVIPVMAVTTVAALDEVPEDLPARPAPAGRPEPAAVTLRGDRSSAGQRRSHSSASSW